MGNIEVKEDGRGRGRRVIIDVLFWRCMGVFLR